MATGRSLRCTRDSTRLDRGPDLKNLLFACLLGTLARPATAECCPPSELVGARPSIAAESGTPHADNPVLVRITLKILDWVAGWAVGRLLDEIVSPRELRSTEADLQELRAEIEENFGSVGAALDQLRSQLRLIESNIVVIRQLLSEKPDRAEMQAELGLIRRELDRRFYEVEEEFADVYAELTETRDLVDRVVEHLDLGGRFFYFGGGALGEVSRISENGAQVDAATDPAFGWAGRIGYLSNHFDVFGEVSQRGTTLIRNEAMRAQIASMRRDRALLVFDLGFTRKPGFRFRISGEYQAREISSDDGAVPASEDKTYAGGVGIGLGGWNDLRTRGAGVTADWRFGITDSELFELESGIPISEQTKTLIHRYELWGNLSAVANFWMLFARVHFEIFDETLFDERRQVFDFKVLSLGATLGMNFLIR